MFYYSEIRLFDQGKSRTDDMGISKPGEERFLRTIACDVQPYSKDRLYRDYGYQDEVKYRVFSDPAPEVKPGRIATYKGKDYRIVRVIEWDSYSLWVINDD